MADADDKKPTEAERAAYFASLRRRGGKESIIDRVRRGRGDSLLASIHHYGNEARDAVLAKFGRRKEAPEDQIYRDQAAMSAAELLDEPEPDDCRRAGEQPSGWLLGGYL